MSKKWHGYNEYMRGYMARIRKDRLYPQRKVKRIMILYKELPEDFKLEVRVLIFKDILKGGKSNEKASIC